MAKASAVDDCCATEKEKKCTFIIIKIDEKDCHNSVLMPMSILYIYVYFISNIAYFYPMNVA